MSTSSLNSKGGIHGVGGTQGIDLLITGGGLELVDELDIKDTVVICPYNAQCKLLRQLNPELVVHTIDSFQGQEADCIILTTVRTSKIGFWFRPGGLPATLR